MLKKVVFLLLAMGIAEGAFATDEETKWVDAKKSLSELLDSGWKIENYSPADSNWGVETAASSIIDGEHQLGQVPGHPRGSDCWRHWVM